MPEFDLEIDVLIVDEIWPLSLEADILRAINAAIAHLKLDVKVPAELSVLLTNDQHQHELNAQWREKQSSTNVLSFPQIEPFSPVAGLIGDISLAYETVAKEAQSENKSLKDHVSHLCVHGFLHILGYDHLTNDDAEQMELLEREILLTLEIDDPYTEIALENVRLLEE
ncbi:rRNA maturation RNase YbeY [Maritalea sp.]|uniref:rRNA maturation RNase YbeY n=1 Tax=Maritalea sp. TaxID=2003361 RepID=UPI003EF38E80